MVTGFLPTICPCPSLEEDIELLKKLSAAVSYAAEVLGFMIEGHFCHYCAITNVEEMGSN